jgi:hypothetical protein
MRNKTVNFTAIPVNQSKPLGFQQVNPSFRLVSPPAMAPEAELRVVRNSQVAAARTNNFPVSNPIEGVIDERPGKMRMKAGRPVRQKYLLPRGDEYND